LNLVANEIEFTKLLLCLLSPLNLLWANCKVGEWSLGWEIRI